MAEEGTPTTESQTTNFSLLAREMYGDGFVGDVPESPADDDSPKEDPEEVAQTKEEETPEDSPPDDSEVSEEGEPIATLQELIEYNEWDPEWVNNLRVPVKVDGQSSEAPLADLVKSYQMSEAAEKRLEEAKTKAKSITQELAEKNEALQGQYAAVAKMIDNAEQLFQKDNESVDWDKLRSDDPAEYAARREDMKQRRERIDAMKREAAESWQKTVQERQKEAEEQMKQHLQKEQELLLEKLPDWKDEEKASSEKKKISDFLLNQGFTHEDVGRASDHRLILMARKAMLYDELQANTNAAKKKVVKVPKVLKPGAPKPKEQIDQERVEKARERMRKSGSLDDAWRFLQSRRGGK